MNNRPPGLARLIRDNFDPEEAIKALVKIALEAEDPTVRLQAISLLMERGWGRPPQFVVDTA